MIHRLLSALLLAIAMVPSHAEAATIVHPGDTISVDIMNFNAVIDNSQDRNKALDPGNVVVSGDGSISIPVAGTIRVAGMTTSQISGAVRRRLEQYVRDPSVAVTLLQQNQVIFLTGATTGTLPYLPGETLASAIGQLQVQLLKNDSGNLTPFDKNQGTLLRSAIDIRNVSIERDEHIGSSIDGEELLRTGRPGPILQPEDTLRFANKPVEVTIRGEVAAPGPIYLYPTDTLEAAIQEAGGPTLSASTKDVSLVRGGQETPLPLGSPELRQRPQNGDTIIVRAAPHVTVIGQVPNPGEETLRNGSTLLSALYVAGGPTKWANVRDIQVVHDGLHTSYNLVGLTHGDLSSNVPLVDGDVVYVPEGHRLDPTLLLAGILGSIGALYNVSHI